MTIKISFQFTKLNKLWQGSFYLNSNNVSLFGGMLLIN